MSVNKSNQLVAARHAIGLYSIEEIRQMFARSEDGKPMGRHSIDFAMNSGQLPYISPNNRDRFVYLHDFLKFMVSEPNGSKVNTSPSPSSLRIVGGNT